MSAFTDSTLDEKFKKQSIYRINDDNLRLGIQSKLLDAPRLVKQCYLNFQEWTICSQRISFLFMNLSVWRGGGGGAKQEKQDIFIFTWGSVKWWHCNKILMFQTLMLCVCVCVFFWGGGGCKVRHIPTIVGLSVIVFEMIVGILCDDIDRHMMTWWYFWKLVAAGSTS